MTDTELFFEFFPSYWPKVSTFFNILINDIFFQREQIFQLHG